MVEGRRERDARDGCSHIAMFGNGIGEKKHRINEMAAYYLARAAVVFFCFFTYSALQHASYQKCVQGAYRENLECSHVFNAHF